MDCSARVWFPDPRRSPSRTPSSRRHAITLCVLALSQPVLGRSASVDPESSEVPSDKSVSREWFQNPRRFPPATLSPSTLCAVALLGFSLSLPAGSLLDRACLLDEGSARVGGFLALTRPAGRAHPRHSQHRASASPLPRPRHRRRLSLFVIVTNEDPPNAHQAQHRPVQATGAMSA